MRTDRARTVNRPPEVDSWIAELDPADRTLYDAIESVILKTGLVEQIAYSYKLPTFRRGTRPVTVAKWRGGISLSIRDPAPIEAFKAKQRRIAAACSMRARWASGPARPQLVASRWTCVAPSASTSTPSTTTKTSASASARRPPHR